MFVEIAKQKSPYSDELKKTLQKQLAAYKPMVGLQMIEADAFWRKEAK